MNLDCRHKLKKGYLDYFGGVGLKNCICPIMTAAVLTCVLATVASAADVKSVPETGLERQLRINKETLLRGTNEQIRVDAALTLLTGDRKAWKILLETLGLKDNPSACQTVCKALIEVGDSIREKKNFLDFREPLIDILKDQGEGNARLAAQALLVFKYNEISKNLKNLARSGNLERQGKLNMVYALGLWPTEKDAISELVRLLNDSDQEVTSAAKETLPYWAAGMDREDILRQLRRKSPSEIIRDRMEFLEKQVLKLQNERELWLKLYFSRLDEDYGKAGEADRDKILEATLSSQLTEEKLWALKIVKQQSETIWPDTVVQKIKELIADERRDVRLETAKVLSRRSEWNPAQALLAQHKVEQDGEVKLVIFEALGEACYYALLTKEFELPAPLLNKTLKLAGDYTNQKDNPESTIKGVEVIQKLLEFIKFENAQKYLVYVAERYKQELQSPTTNGSLRSELLKRMAGLCRQDSHKAAAAKLFNQYFEKGLDAEDNAVREAAAAGLYNVDRTEALRRFRTGRLIDDESSAVRRVMIKLAGEIGSEEDLDWLVEHKAADNGEGQLVREVIRKILQRQDAAVVVKWVKNLIDAGTRDEHVKKVLEVAEGKAQSRINTDENANADILVEVRNLLVECCRRMGEYDNVIVYCNKLLEIVKNEQEREEIEKKLLDAYLEKGDVDEVGRLVANQLDKGDLGSESELVARIEAHLKSEQVGEEAKASLVKVLSNIPVEEERTKWEKQLKTWCNLVGIDLAGGDQDV